MQFDFIQATNYAWLALATVWVLTAARAKPSVRRQAGGSRLLHILVMAAVFALLFRHDIRIGPLASRIVPASTAALLFGFALTLLGAAFAIWARLQLGANWSAAVTVKEDHALVQHGPYRLVRHPIYAGGLAAMLGTAVVFGEAGCFLAVALGFAAFWWKTRIEEEFMTGQFGAEYSQYQRSVKRLIPFVL
jgi:protein-S-isoprenylcysteine O-methyltransferase Ste14